MRLSTRGHVGMRGEAARGHAGMGTRGQGGYKLEAPRPRGSVDQGTHLRVSGRGWSGNRYGFPGSGTGAGLNLYLVLNTRTRDLRMELQLRQHTVLPLPEAPHPRGNLLFICSAQN
jgi:hypothetical protein